jgi:Protease inhibitor Inh
MTARPCLAVIAVALFAAGAAAQAPVPSDAAKDMVGDWEISNAARDKTCPVTFKLEPAASGFKLDLDGVCGTAFPALKDVVVWAMGPNDEVRLLNSKGAVILDFMEVEAHMYEAERKGEGLFFMRTQDAIKAATVTPEQVFGEWILLKEFEKPLCRLTLSNASAGGESYKITVKQGCDPSVADVELSTWRLDSDGLLLTGRSGSWRFSESDATTWERIPASSDPLVLMRQ